MSMFLSRFMEEIVKLKIKEASPIKQSLQPHRKNRLNRLRQNRPRLARRAYNLFSEELRTFFAER